jgi:hypothetical protein
LAFTVWLPTHTPGQAQAATPTLNFQARLENSSGAIAPDGNYNVEFKLYEGGTENGGGTNVWTETRQNSSGTGVRVSNGYLTVNLGSVTNFPSTINWDADLYLTMNIGGVSSSATPTYDGEMNPRLKLTSVPYAFQAQSATQLQTIQGSNSGSLAFDTLTTNRSILLPDEDGTVCLQGSASCGFATASSLGSYIELQSSTPGTAQAGNFNINGTGIAATLQGSSSLLTPLVDTISAGTLNLGTSTATAVSIGKTGVTTTVNGALTVSEVTRLNGNVGINIGTAAPTADLTFGEGASRSIAVQTRTTNAAGNDLTISAGAAGTGASAFIGGKLTLQGGNAAGTGNANGGDVVVIGGIGIGTGVSGLVNLGPTAYRSVTNTSCAVSCTIDQTNVDNYGVILVSTSVSGISVSLPDPVRTSDIGRVVYITADAASTDFILDTNGGTLSVAMRNNTTATMIWNGTDWTPGGASNATTLQATYNNGSNPGSTPEIKLDSVRGTIDIQDADTSIGQDLFNIRGSNPLGLGTVLFGVSHEGVVTIQNTADTSSSFRVLNSSGDYVLNVNSSNNYVINNGITTPGNNVVNPSFESGGAITSGEEGWFGPAQASIVNSSANAHAGNYELQVTPNGTNLDTYAGKYYEVKPGDSLYFEGWVKNSAGANGTAGIQITWYDKDKANPTFSTDYATLPGTSYILKSINATVPAGKYFARVSAAVRSTATTGTFYFDDFYLKKSTEQAPVNFQNSVDSAAAFKIQSAGSAQTLFTANTSNNTLKVGDSTGSDTATTILVLDSTTADPTTSLSTKNGGLFYRSDTNSLKAIIGGTVVDICTTAVTCTGYSASAASSIQLQASSPGTAQTGNFNITGTGILTQLQSQDSASGNTNNLVIRTGNATSGNSGNLTIDTGTASGTAGTITIGHQGVGAVNMPGSNLQLGTSNTGGVGGSILFRNTGGNNTVTLKASGGNPIASWNLVLPQNPGSAGDCLKDSSGTGTLAFSSCSSGVTTNLQDVYNNSSSPATITLADSKNLIFNAQDTTTDPSVLVNLQCLIGCGTSTGGAGRFAIQNGGSDVVTVLANGGGIVLSVNTQIGSSTTDYGILTLFQLDSFDGTSGGGETTCATATYGALYYNTTTGTIRSCTTSGWADITNPEQLGLMSYGIVPSSGNDPYDLAATGTQYVSGPCRVSWHSLTSIQWEACTAYSGGKRISVQNSSVAYPSGLAITTTTTNVWQHLCLTGTNGQPALTTASSSETTNMPSFSLTAPVVCLADIKNDTSTSGRIGDLYDTRTFTTDQKEAITTSSAVALGMLVDASAVGISPAAAGSAKLYGTVVATDGSTSSTTPNAIITTMGPAWIKASAGTAGQFVKTSTTNGYGNTTAAIPNNSFYYSAGNTRTDFDTTCTSAATCSSSLYVNFNVR